MSNKWVRSISFNKTNKDDILRLQLIGKKSFSRFIKKLLDDEIKRKGLLPSDTTHTATPQPERKVLPTKLVATVTPKKPQTPPPYNPMLSRSQR
ncbi:hypothetical protein [Shouchella miscanthi]|uniref:hypothetical protein n=1 Tax=Shouchella miscanthi TaxID=2598861 RepID=UPI0011A616FF|nr:hypothetical protein [Shouchella miscanthi]